MNGRRRRGGPNLKIIKWRDIPAQVNGTSGDQKVQVELPPRFQKAIDRAAMVAGKKDANSYIAEMGSDSRSADASTDIETAVAELVAELETKFTPDLLNTFVRTGGFEPEAAEHAPAEDPQPLPDQDIS